MKELREKGELNMFPARAGMSRHRPQLNVQG